MKKKRIILLTLVFILTVGCQSVLTCWSTVKNTGTETESTILIIDVRSQDEFSEGHIKGALNIPYTSISQDIGKYANNKDQEIILYCRSGRRAGIAYQTLKDLGYTNVENIGGYSEAQELLE